MNINNTYKSKIAALSNLSDSKSAEHFNELYEAIQSVEDDETTKPNYSLKIFSKEAEGLIPTIRFHENALRAKNFDASHTVNIEKLVGAYRHAQTRMAWATDSYNDSIKQWKTLSPLAYELRNDMLNEYRFIAFGDEAMTKLLKDVSKGTSIADLIEDLHILAHPTESVIKSLEDINFNLDQLKYAANLAAELGQVQKEAALHRFAITEERKIRDKVVTLLMVDVAAVQRWAKLVFNKDKKTLEKFTSQHKRLKNKARYESEDDELEFIDSEEDVLDMVTEEVV
ncbi:MAG: hypothetical protein OCD01_04250 [Fibrobacterales bacterium]